MCVYKAPSNPQIDRTVGNVGNMWKTSYIYIYIFIYHPGNTFASFLGGGIS